jgi:hypothetical protein
VPIAPPPMLRPGVDRGTENGDSGTGAGTAIGMDSDVPGGNGVEPGATGMLVGDRKIALGAATPGLFDGLA